MNRQGNFEAQFESEQNERDVAGFLSGRDEAGPSNAALAQQGRNPCMTILAVLMLIVLVIALVAGIALWKTTTSLVDVVNQAPSEAVNFFFPEKRLVPSVDGTMVITQLQTVSKLETMRYTAEKVIEERRIGNGLLGGSERLLLVVHGEAVIGLDLGKLAPDDIQIEEDRVWLRLPRAELFNAYVDVDKTFVYDYQRDIWLPGNELDLLASAHKRALEEIKASAQSAEITQAAETYGKNFVQIALLQLGFSNVSITFSPDEVEGVEGTATPVVVPDNPSTTEPLTISVTTTASTLQPVRGITSTIMPVLTSTHTITGTP